MGSTVEKNKKRYNYADYLNWPENEKWEIIDGVPYNMTPAPSRRHQKISGALFNRLYNYLEGKPCEVYSAPFDVRLPVSNETDEQIQTVVQPDLVVVCDPSKLDERGCKGAPDLVVEILSPLTAKKDLREKFFLYERVGVKEYWIVHPAEKTISVFKLEEELKYGRAEIYSEEDKLTTEILAGLQIDLSSVFKE